MSVGEKMQMCLDTLMSIRESGYWPYASPAPCSTEVRIKESLDKSINNLSTALYWHKEMFGKTGRPDDRCVGTKIVEK